MIRRLQRATDFERVLKTRSRASSAHFAVHHLAGRPAARLFRSGPSAGVGLEELSTGDIGDVVPAVECPSRLPLANDEPGIWLGAVVPKRHARRAVTRTMLKRQIRNVVVDGAAAMTTGLWVVRLRAPFDRVQFPSAASDALRRLARSELQQVIASAVERLQRR